ncbi:MAG: bifunctional response regulator/alkaline phosphatase family protein [candidate division KSB1 bacterium]|nr:bifunctional response regulator/alkaline phosphatase family protein [candidate division KSB1 bacterium]
MSNEKKILWVDDEIELLRPHVLYLESKGYSVTTLTNAEDAVERVKVEDFDIVLLDEMLNGMDGLSALSEIKEIRPGLPIIMVTKSEEESLMEEAIGSKIDDYLTKPVNPSQILLVCKKLLEKRKIAGHILSRDYAEEFNKLSLRLMEPLDWKDWIEIHVELSEWELELDAHPELGLKQLLSDQRRACNTAFGKFIENHYKNWLYASSRPPLSVDIIGNYVLPHLKNGKRTIFLVIDALRLDQWLVLEPLLRNWFRITRDYYYSILPTATPYSRNAIFSGLFPADIERMYPQIWEEAAEEEDDQSLNRYEHMLLEELLKRLSPAHQWGIKYAKILDVKEATDVARRINEYASAPLGAIVLNFVDILAHSRSSIDLLKEMIPDEAAFRSMTRAWFEHSAIFQALQHLAEHENTVVITSDHGSIRGLRGAKVIGDRRTSTSLRYKYGKNIKADPKQALIIPNPAEYRLPSRGINSNYIIAKEDFYFVYPTNYHYYLNYYADSFQHGGISLEEMILPVVTLEPK